MNPGWAWYPSLEMCDTSHLSLEFLTKKADGMLLYNGPMTTPEPEETLITDFISLELDAGNPRLLIDFGSGTLELKLKPPRRLDDGDWHRIDVFWDTENVRMVLDLCRFAPIYEPEDGSTAVFNSTSCEVKGKVPPFNEYLDVNAPLQIGGVSHGALERSHYNWDHLPHGKGFNGCIRNLIHNSKVSVDLNFMSIHSFIFFFFHFFYRSTIWRNRACGKEVNPDVHLWTSCAPEMKYPVRE